MAMKLYDLAGADANLRFSPYCWRAKFALAMGTKEDMEEIRELAEVGALRPIVARRFPLARIAAAHVAPITHQTVTPADDRTAAVAMVSVVVAVETCAPPATGGAAGRPSGV